MVAGEDLTGKEGYVVQIHSVGGKPVIKVPQLVNSPAVFVLIAGATSGGTVTIRPLDGSRNVRLKLKGSVAAGNSLILADPGTLVERGMVRDLPNVVGVHRAVAIAEADGVNGQFILARPHVADYEITP